MNAQFAKAILAVTLGLILFNVAWPRIKTALEPKKS